MNCLIYARVSTDKQAQKDLSIPAQIAAIKEYARTSGWKIVGHFVDEGESARTADRPELKKLLRHCREHKEIDAVIVHKLDRMARNLIDYGTIKAILKQKGIRLISVSEPFDDNPVGHLLENIIASISEWYSANLGEEIKKAGTAKINKGEWPHKPPLGYMSVRDENNRAKHVPDPEAAPLVRQTFELCSTGNCSLQMLSEEMHSRGLRTRLGRMYTSESMKKLLRRKFYIGRLEWKGKLYRGTHEPIISEELFYRVQEVLERRGSDTGEKGKLEFLLRGVTYCDACGQKLTAEVHPRGSYYRCLPALGKPRCSQSYTPVRSLDGQLESAYERLQPPKKVLEILRHEVAIIASGRTNVAEKEIRRTRKTLEETEEKEVRLLDEMLAGKIDRHLYEKMQARYTEEKSQAEASLSRLETDYSDPLDFLDKCIMISSMLAFLHKRFGYNQKKDLLKAVFASIHVRDKAIVSMKLNPPFSLLLGDDVGKMFDNVSSGGLGRMIFEQLLNVFLSESSSGFRDKIMSLELRSRSIAPLPVGDGDSQLSRKRTKL